MYSFVCKIGPLCVVSGRELYLVQSRLEFLPPQTNARMAKQSSFQNPDFSRAYKLLVVEKQTPKQAVRQLCKEGLDEESAKLLVAQVQRESSKTEARGGARDIVVGAMWCLGGTIATIYNDYFIFYGAVLFGAFQLIRGLVIRYAPRG